MGEKKIKIVGSSGEMARRCATAGALGSRSSTLWRCPCERHGDERAPGLGTRRAASVPAAGLAGARPARHPAPSPSRSPAPYPRRETPPAPPPSRPVGGAGCQSSGPRRAAQLPRSPQAAAGGAGGVPRSSPSIGRSGPSITCRRQPRPLPPPPPRPSPPSAQLRSLRQVARPLPGGSAVLAALRAAAPGGALAGGMTAEARGAPGGG